MNRKFQHFQKIEKPVITKNFNIHKFDWWMGIISSPNFCQTSSYYSNSRQKKKKKTLTFVTIPLKKKKKKHSHSSMKYWLQYYWIISVFIFCGRFYHTFIYINWLNNAKS